MKINRVLIEVASLFLFYLVQNMSCWLMAGLDFKRSLLCCCPDGKHEFCNEFDLRKPLERQFLSGKRIDCFSIQDSPNLITLHDRCATFLSQVPRWSSVRFRFPA